MSNDQNFDSLLDANLEDLADLPEFTSFPAGVHKCTLAITQKSINGKPMMEIKLTGIETVELAKPEEDKPINAGQVASALYDLANEFGQGAFKRLVSPLAAHFGCSSLRDVIENAEGSEVAAVTSYRKSKKDGNEYFEIKKLMI